MGATSSVGRPVGARLALGVAVAGCTLLVLGVLGELALGRTLLLEHQIGLEVGARDDLGLVGGVGLRTATSIRTRALGLLDGGFVLRGLSLRFVAGFVGRSFALGLGGLPGGLGQLLHALDLGTGVLLARAVRRLVVRGARGVLGGLLLGSLPLGLLRVFGHQASTSIGSGCCATCG